MPKGDVCWAALYTHDSWDEYWEGTLKRTNGNIGTLTRQSITPMFAFGISDRINVLAMLPWIRSEASGGQLKAVSGFQDLSLFVKIKAVDLTAGPGQFTIHPVVGFTVPTSNYLEDYAPFSLGMGCMDLSVRGILQYQLNMGLYVRGTASYQVRGNAKIERDFYYTTQGIYSDKVDMPNALTYSGTLGSWLFDNTLNVDFTYDGLNSYGGHDIRRQDAGFPSNKMVFTRVGGQIHYFLPFIKGMGVIVSGSKILTGRNVGQSTAFTAGLTYQHTLFHSGQKETIQ